MLEWPDTADARPEDFEKLIVEPFWDFASAGTALRMMARASPAV